MKKVLVIGGGGREHALVWKLTGSPEVGQVYCAPGNAGIRRLAQCVSIAPDNIVGLADWVEKERIDLTVVGPELPLVLGIVDLFQRRGLTVCGPDSRAAELERSKAFTKDFLRKYRIPTADYQTFSSPEQAKLYVRQHGVPIVIKADGLAAGKGVILADREETALEAIDQIMVKRVFGAAGRTVILEDFLYGEEASFIIFTDGKHVVPTPSSQDHKAVGDDDQGPNTGGMGAYSPAPVVTKEVEKKVLEKIIFPTLEGMAAEGRRYRGILYAGLMISGGEPRLLEYNVRLGDPETQPLLMRMKSDLFPILEGTTGNLQGARIDWNPRPAVCVVMAASGYPGDYAKGKVISGVEAAEELADVQIFHAGTAWNQDRLVTNGGRVLGVTALGDSIAQAIDQAYLAVSRIAWEGAYFRKDIGKKALLPR